MDERDLQMVVDDETPRGIFITFEGGEGVGKSTQIRLLSQRLQQAGYQVTCLREPGGTAIGEAIRGVLLDPDNEQMSPRAELLLYEASRAQLMDQVIRPALERGEVVLCDRFFDSTTVYQGLARGLGMELAQQANALACGDVVPDRTVILCLDARTGLERATQEGADRLERESLAFHEGVHEGFRRLAQREPQRVRLVDTCEFKEATAQRVLEQVMDLFPGLDELEADLDSDLEIEPQPESEEDAD